MNRTTLLVAGVIAWTAAGVDAAGHLYSGDLLAPLLMGAVLAVWVGIRRYQLAHRRVPVAA